MASFEVENSRKSLVSNSSMLTASHADKALNNVESESQFWFWAKQLTSFADDKSVIFAAVENNRLIKLHIIDIIKALKDIDYFEAVENINQLPQPNFFKITFDSVSMVEIFVDTVSQINGHPIQVIDANNIPNLCTIAINTLPPDVIKSQLLPQLATWGDCVRLSSQFIPKMHGKKVQIGQTKLTFKIKENYSITDIPYFVRIFGFKVFLYIQGRQRICYRCNSATHLVANCPYKYCGICRKLTLVSHSCVLSYASMVSPVVTPIIVPVMHDKLLEDLDDVSEQPCGESDMISQSSISSSEDEEPDTSNAVKTDLNINNDVPVETAMVAGSDISCAPKRMRTRSLSTQSKRKSYTKASKVNSQLDSPKIITGNKRKSKHLNGKDKDHKELKKDNIPNKSDGGKEHKVKNKQNKNKIGVSVSDALHDGSSEVSTLASVGSQDLSKHDSNVK